MRMRHHCVTVLSALFLLSAVAAAQEANINWKVHDAGKVRQVITNTGAINAVGLGLFNYPGLINCEFPPNSREEHIADGGLWIGAPVRIQVTPDSSVVDSLVSVTEGEGSNIEFYPGPDPSDSIWVVHRGDTVNLPWWPNYVGVSDQDFVCKYTDYGPVSIRQGGHVPMYLSVIQASYAWSSAPLDEIIVVNYWITSTKLNLDNVYLTSWLNGNEGYVFCGDYALDDQSYFRRSLLMAFCTDLPGGCDGTAYGPIGDKIYPPLHPTDSLRVTYQWYNGGKEGLPARDNDRFAQMTSGIIMQDQVSTGDGTKAQVSVGPYRLHVGDTLHFSRVLVLGKGEDGVLKNANTVDILVSKGYRVPSPPPKPPARYESTSHGLTLHWDPRPGDVNPETYVDPYRSDSVAQPFEGYRVYKSTHSNTGPWTLLAEYDIPGNSYGQNTGLKYEYTDIGLLNNFDYYYTVTAFSKPDSVSAFPSLESSLNANALTIVPGPKPADYGDRVGNVSVVPNPYRGDIAYYSYNPAWEKPQGTRDRWMEQDRRVQFINLPKQCNIKVYTIAGDLVTTIQHSSEGKGYEDWNLTSSVGQAIASGIYLFTAEDPRTGQVQVGKFVVIK